MPDEKCVQHIMDKVDEERRKKLTDEKLDLIAERLEQKFYASVGKGFVSKFFVAVGLIVVSVLTYLKLKGL
jgi:hypothetical protein